MFFWEAKGLRYRVFQTDFNNKVILQRQRNNTFGSCYVGKYYILILANAKLITNISNVFVSGPILSCHIRDASASCSSIGMSMRALLVITATLLKLF